MASVCGASGLLASVLMCEAVVMCTQVLMVWVTLLIILDFQVRLVGVLWRLGEVEVGRFCVV